MFNHDETFGVKIVKIGTSMILCFYWQEVESFKEKHKIIDVRSPVPASVRPEPMSEICCPVIFEIADSITP